MNSMRIAIPSVGVTLLLLAALYVTLKPSPAVPHVPGTVRQAYNLSVEEARPDTPPPLIKVTQGDIVTLTIASQRRGSVAIHGYPEEVELNPGGAVTLTLTADHAGSYPIHVHGADGSHVPIGGLEVQPR